MASGRPVLSFEINGIPDEYYNYLIKIKSMAINDIVTAIKVVGDMEESRRAALGLKAKDFIIKTKSANYQTKRILEFIMCIDSVTEHFNN